mgnify:FL=1
MPPSEGDRAREAAAPLQIVACPTCRRSVPWRPENPFRPFCSERCRLIDLGAWAEGERFIPGDGDWESGTEED